MTQEATEPISLGTLVGRIAAEIENSMPPGDVAALRRLHPGAPAPPAFWRLVVAHLDETLPEHPARRGEALRRWAVIVQAVAEMRGLHAPALPFGRALAIAGVSEARALKLVRVTGNNVADATRTIVHQLANSAVPANLTDLARLILSEGRPDEQESRDRIAYDYYKEALRAERENDR